MTLVRMLLCVAVLLGLGVVAAVAQTFQPGQQIEYRRTGAANWEPGTIIGPTQDGRQYRVRQKPSQFFPEGAESVFSPNELRVPQAAQAPPAPQRPVVVQPAPTAGPVACPAGGPMTEEDVLAYSRQVLGPNPWGPHRDAGVARIRDCINRRGATFVSGRDFDNRMHAQGTNAVHINYAIDNNWGPPPALADYFGTFDLTSANRGSNSVKRKNATTVRKTTIDSQARLGGLAIDANGTYVWDTRGDGRAIVRGTWRQATPGDMMEYEGGVGIVLLKAREAFDYHVRVNRTPGWAGDTWIEVGTGRGRQSVQYGLKR